MSATDEKPMPTLYISHGGGPCFFMDWSAIGPADTWNNMAHWLSNLGKSIRTPSAIVVISAHWEGPQFTVNRGAKPSLLYDYEGFPEHTYALKYDAPGEPQLAARIEELFQKQGLAIQTDPERGLDHGVFVPFKLIYPEANIPIVQLSLHQTLDPALHHAAGAALEPLRREGVLIVGSGMSYHNLNDLFRNSGGPPSEEFDTWLTAAVCAPQTEERIKHLNQWAVAPSARRAHPRAEHLLPLMVVSGAAGRDQGVRVFSDRVMGARTSAFQFGT